MANNDTPRGARCITPDVKVQTFAVSSANDVRIGKDDYITPVNDGYVSRAAAGEQIIGSAVKIMNSDGVPISYLAASTVGSVDVAMAAEGVEYVMQDDGDTTTFARTHLHTNCDIVDGDCSTVTGISIQEIDINTTTTNAAQLILIGLYPEQDNAFGVNADIRVAVNESYLGTSTKPA